MATTKLRAALVEVLPVADSIDNSQMSDVIGNKSDTTAGNSLVSLVKIAGEGYQTTLKLIDCTDATPITVFTVTGDVLMKIYAVVKTPLTTAGAITVELGVAGATTYFIAQVADATDLILNEIWHDATPDATRELSSVATERITTGGQDVILTTTGVLTAGGICFYCIWKPLSADGNVV